MNNLPLARTTGVVVQDLGKEILVYDLNTDKAYNLNETSATIYQACDGKTSIEELRVKTKFTDEIIFLAIDELQKENLIEEDSSFVSPFARLSRREVIRRVGLASMVALPVIASLVAPTAAMAQSPGPPTLVSGTVFSTQATCVPAAFGCNSSCSLQASIQCISGSAFVLPCDTLGLPKCTCECM